MASFWKIIDDMSTTPIRYQKSNVRQFFLSWNGDNSKKRLQQRQRQWRTIYKRSCSCMNFLSKYWIKSIETTATTKAWQFEDFVKANLLFNEKNKIKSKDKQSKYFMQVTLLLPFNFLHRRHFCFVTILFKNYQVPFIFFKEQNSLVRFLFDHEHHPPFIKSGKVHISLALINIHNTCKLFKITKMKWNEKKETKAKILGNVVSFLNFDFCDVCA